MSPPGGDEVRNPSDRPHHVGGLMIEEPIRPTTVEAVGHAGKRKDQQGNIGERHQKGRCYQKGGLGSSVV